MKKLLGLLVALATLGFASPVFACPGECNCKKKGKQAEKANCDHAKKKEKSHKNCGDKTADKKSDDSSDAEATAEAELSIDGMTCGGCANHLTAALEKVDGVVEADVSHEDGKATVRYNADKVDTDALVEAVNSTHNGKFTAKLVSESSKS